MSRRIVAGTGAPAARPRVNAGMPWSLCRPGFKSESYRLGRDMGGPAREGFWLGLAEDVEWSADLTEAMLTTLRSGLEEVWCAERPPFTTAEIETALAKARSLTDNCHAGLRAHARSLHAMSERACCALCASLPLPPLPSPATPPP